MKRKKTIKFSKLKRLEFCNSKDLPPRIWIGGKLMEWVGIGWIEIDDDEDDGTAPTVVED